MHQPNRPQLEERAIAAAAFRHGGLPRRRSARGTGSRAARTRRRGGHGADPQVRKVRQALDEASVAHKYLEYGSYLSKWKERLAIKLWSGWPTFPQVFVRGTLMGGEDLTKQALADGARRRPGGRAVRDKPRWGVLMQLRPQRGSRSRLHGAQRSAGVTHDRWNGPQASLVGHGRPQRESTPWHRTVPYWLHG
jgi:hypothetical protein